MKVEDQTESFVAGHFSIISFLHLRALRSAPLLQHRRYYIIVQDSRILVDVKASDDGWMVDSPRALEDTMRR